MANKSKNATKIYDIDKLPTVLTLEEAGLLLGYTGEHLRRMSINHDFPGFQLFEGYKRGSWRVMKEDLIEWLEYKRQKSKYFMHNKHEH